MFDFTSDFQRQDKTTQPKESGHTVTDASAPAIATLRAVANLPLHEVWRHTLDSVWELKGPSHTQPVINK